MQALEGGSCRQWVSAGQGCTMLLLMWQALLLLHGGHACRCLSSLWEEVALLHAAEKLAKLHRTRCLGAPWLPSPRAGCCGPCVPGDMPLLCRKHPRQ